MYDKILKHVTQMVEAGRGPDLVFLTGDLAFQGEAGEYASLEAALIQPLRRIVGPDARLFMVPGNHDLDRHRLAPPRVLLTDKVLADAFQSPEGDGPRKRKELLFPRFEAYSAFEQRNADWGVPWLDSADGTASWHGEVQGAPVSVVGLNTAWFSQDNEDWGKLTPGRLITEKALEAAVARDPTALFVLGHHPLEAFFGDGPSSDGRRVRDRLRDAKAFYMHGHLHESTVEQIGAQDAGVVTFLAPAAFQAHDNPTWPNGLQWGSFEPAEGALIVEPYLWNERQTEYQFDNGAGRNQHLTDSKDGFWVRRPGPVAATTVPTPTEPPPTATAITPAIAPAIAPGWEILTPDDLALKTAERPSPRDMADWFDGQFPRWEVAAAEGIRPRLVVENLARRFEAAHHTAPLPMAILLTGAGGEGKSAALMQLAAMLLRGKQDWTCLWRSATAAELPEDLFERLKPRPGHAWIVAIDDAESIAGGIPAALRKIQPRVDVHLILAAREADWSIRGLRDTMWQGAAAFQRSPISGLDQEDARRIADGWTAYGDEAMGLLRGQTAEKAAATLLGHARNQAAKKEEGALLGALLISRTGEDLKERVIRLMQPWAAAAGIGPRNLLDIYAMIAAMHAENQLYLSNGVLADALGCSSAELEAGPLHTLRREAMIDGGSTYILTRHRQIAEAARDWLVDTGYDLAAAYVSMARAAEVAVSRKSRFLPDISSWRSDLAHHFSAGNAREQATAVAIVKALFETSPNDAMRLTVYASTLRRTGQAKAAFDLLRAEGKRFSHRRDVLYEWSVSAGAIKDQGLAVWLAGRSLADDHVEAVSPTRAKLSLAGMGRGFENIRNAAGVGRFKQAQAACGRLGLLLPDLDETARGYFEQHRTVAPLPSGAAHLTVAADLGILKKSIADVAYECEESNDPAFFESLLGDPEGYSFMQLKAVLQPPVRNGPG